MTRSKHPAILKYPMQENRITGLMRNDEEFAEICRDYARIVDEIARIEGVLGKDGAVLAEMLRLRSDLESDIAEMLSEDR